MSFHSADREDSSATMEILIQISQIESSMIVFVPTYSPQHRVRSNFDALHTKIYTLLHLFFYVFTALGSCNGGRCFNGIWEYFVWTPVCIESFL